MKNRLKSRVIAALAELNHYYIQRMPDYKSIQIFKKQLKQIILKDSYMEYKYYIKAFAGILKYYAMGGYLLKYNTIYKDTAQNYWAKQRSGITFFRKLARKISASSIFREIEAAYNSDNENTVTLLASQLVMPYKYVEEFYNSFSFWDNDILISRYLFERGCFNLGNHGRLDLLSNCIIICLNNSIRLMPPRDPTYLKHYAPFHKLNPFRERCYLNENSDHRKASGAIYLRFVREIEKIKVVKPHTHFPLPCCRTFNRWSEMDLYKEFKDFLGPDSPKPSYKEFRLAHPKRSWEWFVKNKWGHVGEPKTCNLNLEDYSRIIPNYANNFVNLIKKYPRINYKIEDKVNYKIDSVLTAPAFISVHILSLISKSFGENTKVPVQSIETALFKSIQETIYYFCLNSTNLSRLVSFYAPSGERQFIASFFIKFPFYEKSGSRIIINIENPRRVSQ